MLVKFNQSPLTQIDRVFDEMFRSPFQTVSPEFGGFKVDISEDDKAIYIEADMPGMKKEDIKVSVERDMLTIRGERKQESEKKDKNYHRIERFYGSVARSFTLGENVSRDNIDGEFKDGVLRLTLPKVEPVKNTKEIMLR
ncbi:MAG: heat-shock protein Hsp20 [[Candidatus Thermochlorobacteriaceae] bacterium GBChlB]|nr:MAG: heat-shock protein Hsp20 [[Candidatus Thermochlorobacteriaceae] bacterium GBChlB]